jgi:hypothetical protein
LSVSPTPLSSQAGVAITKRVKRSEVARRRLV